MKIMESNLSFFTSRRYEQKTRSEKHLETWVDPPPSSVNPMPSVTPMSYAVTETNPQEIETLPPKLASIKRVLEALTGKKINISNITEATATDPALPPQTLPERLGWGMRYSEFNSYLEAEKSHVTALGTIRTEDGKAMEFTLNLDMQRQFYTETSYQILAGDALKDPLVINFNGSSADLTDTRFSFDINSDGKDETINWLARGSGFLVFDRNKDSIINNGSELFGPATGSGFSELAKLDLDGNGWIDENDPEFGNLMIWSGPSFETSTLIDLSKAGVGAISLSSAETNFTLKDASNSTLGKILRTGVYINENGSMGTVQQLDLVV